MSQWLVDLFDIGYQALFLFGFRICIRYGINASPNLKTGRDPFFKCCVSAILERVEKLIKKLLKPVFLCCFLVAQQAWLFFYKSLETAQLNNIIILYLVFVHHLPEIYKETKWKLRILITVSTMFSRFFFRKVQSISAEGQQGVILPTLLKFV